MWELVNIDEREPRGSTESTNTLVCWVSAASLRAMSLPSAVEGKRANLTPGCNIAGC